MNYIKAYDNDPNMLVREDGLEIRSGPNDEWFEYEQSGSIPQDKFTQEQWDKLNDNSKRRLLNYKP